jgi:zinc transporter ZupT
MATTTTAVTTHINESEVEDGSLTTLMKLKIGLIVLLFCIVYLGLIPAYSKFFRSSKVILSLMNSFSGGVFLAMAFIHILPESVEQYNEAMTPAEEEPVATTGNSTAPAEDHEHEHGHVFPLPYLLFFVGYMMVLLIDRVLAGEHGHSHGHHGGHSEHSHHDHAATEKETPHSERKLVISPDSPDNEQNSSPCKNHGDTPHVHPMVVQDIDNDSD